MRSAFFISVTAALASCGPRMPSFQPPLPPPRYEIQERIRAGEARQPRQPAPETVLVGSTIDAVIALEAQLIVDVIRNATGGVPQLADELESTPAGARDDRLIEHAIERSLWWNPNIDSSRISVAVKDQVAMLRGWVASPAQRRAVLDAAHRAAARAVDDQLGMGVVGWASPPPLGLGESRWNGACNSG